MKRYSYIISFITSLIFLSSCSSELSNNLENNSNQNNLDTKITEIESQFCDSSSPLANELASTATPSFLWINVPKGWCVDWGSTSAWEMVGKNFSEETIIADWIYFRDLNDIGLATDKSLYAHITFDPDQSQYEYSTSGEYEILMEGKDDRKMIFTSDQSHITMKEISVKGFPSTYYQGHWVKGKCTILIQTVVSNFFNPPFIMDSSEFMILSSEMLNNANIPKKCYIFD